MEVLLGKKPKAKTVHDGVVAVPPVESPPAPAPKRLPQWEKLVTPFLRHGAVVSTFVKEHGGNFIWASLLGAWRYVSPFFRVMRLTRPISALTFLACAALTLSSQGQELGFAFAGPLADPTADFAAWLGGIAKYVISLLFVAAWGLGVAIWSRNVLNRERSEHLTIMAALGQAENSDVVTLPGRGKEQVWKAVSHLWPNFLAAACYGSMLWVLLSSWSQQTQIGWWLPAASLFVFFLFAYALVAAFSESAHRRLPLGVLRAAFTVENAALEKTSLWLATLAFGGLLVAFSFWPGASGIYLGSTAVIFAFLFSSTCLLGKLTSAAFPHRLPVLALLLVWALFLSNFSDNHKIRQLDQSAFRQQENVPDELKSWAERNANSKLVEKVERSVIKVSPPNKNGKVSETRVRDKVLRPVIIATAGGGLRAAYWTAAILGELQTRDDKFASKVLAISGVSGGSVGASVYLANLAASGRADCTALQAGETFADRLTSALEYDFLGSSIGGMFTTDLADHLVPFVDFPDRAEALESSWEYAFKQRNGCGVLQSDFNAIAGKDGRPHLLLNSTDTFTGKRVVFSSVAFSANGDSSSRLSEVLEFYSVSDFSTRLSTAAMASARFTYISPAGNVVAKDGTKQGTPSLLMRLIDGGYFENFGAETAYDFILSLVVDAPLPEIQQREVVKPIFIQISSDPLLKSSETPDVEQCDMDAGSATIRDTTEDDALFAQEISAPISGLLKTREARGLLATKRVACLVRALGGRYFNIRMKPKPWPGKQPLFAEHADGSHPPLGWLLGRQSQIQIRQQLSENGDEETIKTINQILTEIGAGENLVVCKSCTSWDAGK